MTLIIAAFLLFISTNAENICPNQERPCDRPGECCSEWGYCGQGEDYCNHPYDFTGSGLTPEGCPECICDQSPSSPDNEEEEEVPPSDPSDPAPEQTFDENCNCIIYGDPHFKMWNCDINNWQGPHETDPLDIYVMTQCNGYTKDDMPFDLIGVTQRYDQYFTSLDYTILKLFIDDDSNICIKNKGNEGVSYNTDCSDNYDIIPPENEAITLGTEGNMFQIEWKFENGYSKLFFNVLFTECEDEYDLTVTTQTVRNDVHDLEEAVEIRVSDCYKEYTCGMCGDFYNTGLTFQTADGNTIELDAGAWGGTANDDTGLTYVYEDETAPLTTTPIPGRRRLALEEHSNVVIGEPCFGIRPQLEIECNAALREYAECCWDRKEFCEDLIVSCGWDSCACVMGKADNLTHAQDENTMGVCITSVVNASMSFTCGLDPDSFAVPDVLKYNEVDINNEGGNVTDVVCKDCYEIGYFFIGIMVGIVVCGIVATLIYLFVIKPKLEGNRLSVMDTKHDKDNMPSDSEACTGVVGEYKM